METVLKNARIVLEDDIILGTVCLENGFIKHISTGNCRIGEDMEGDYLAPGLIELHTDNFEKHLMPRPKVIWPSACAAFEIHDAQIVTSGITTVFDSVRVGEVTEKEKQLDLNVILNAMDEAKTNQTIRAEHFLHLRCELPDPNTAENFTKLAKKQKINLVSLMDHSPYQRQWINMEAFHRYYQTKNWPKGYLENYLEQAQIAQKKHVPRNYAYITDYCRIQGISMASHDDTTAAHVTAASENGVSISEFPTTMEAAAAARACNMTVVMGAPNLVRGGSHSCNVNAFSVAEAGLLTCLSSDYVPYSLLHGAWLLHRRANWNIPQAMRTVTAEPARAAGLNDRGSFSVGKRADLVRFRIHADRPIIAGVWIKNRKVY